MALRKIGVFGHVGNGNLGDEAIIAAVIQNVKARCPHVEVYGFSANPEDTRQRHRIQAFPIRRPSMASLGVDQRDARNVGLLQERLKRQLKTIPMVWSLVKEVVTIFRLLVRGCSEVGFLRRSFEALTGVELLIVAGSGQLFDFFGGAWGYPYTLFKWSLLARLAGARVAFVSVGAGPINSRVSRWLIRCSLALANYRSYRDEGSRRLIERIGVRGENPVFPDLAYSLKLPASDGRSNPVKPRLIGINPMPFCDGRYWPENDRHVYETYVYKVADFTCWLFEQGYGVMFFATQVHADPPVITDVMTIVKNSGRIKCADRVIAPRVTTLNDLIAQISLAEVVVTTRFHGIILSSLMNKPVLALSYQEKMDLLMRSMGQGDYLLDIRTFDVQSLRDRFRLLERNQEGIRREMAQKLVEFQRAQDIQYGRLLNGELCAVGKFGMRVTELRGTSAERT